MMNDLYNTDFEISLRLLILLDEWKSAKSADMLSAVDFISVYAKSFGIADKNINGDNELKFSVFASRRNLIEKSIKRLVVDGMVKSLQTKNGFRYRITAVGSDRSKKMSGEYATEYRFMAKAAIQFVAGMSEHQALSIINQKAISSLQGGVSNG